MMKITIATTINTKNIPTPIPALKMPLMTEQLENVVSIKIIQHLYSEGVTADEPERAHGETM